MTRITQEFYRWFGDDFDVLNIVFEPLRFQNRGHGVVKNQVRSIGGAGGAGGTFACDVFEDSRGVVLGPRPDAPAFNDLDLYLMGLMPASQVRTRIVFADQAAVANVTCRGQVFTDAVTRVSVNDVITACRPVCRASSQQHLWCRA